LCGEADLEGSVKDTKKWDQLEVIDYTPKQKGDRDVDIKIECCGVCASDVSPYPPYPYAHHVDEA
jgi:threonine dehydrogenase-like Zn-dependent dehydrogenase